MGDRYQATLQIWPWPDRPDHVDAVRVWLEDEFGAIRQPEDAEILGVPNVDAERVLSLDIEEALGGVSELLEAQPQGTPERSLVELLQDARLSFVFRDVGGGAGGREVSWRPGLAGLRERRILSGDELALSESDAIALMAASGPEAAAAAVANYFAPLEKFVD